MVRRAFRIAFAAAASLAGLSAPAQTPATLRYTGNAGQQQITLQVEVVDDTLRDARYSYRGQSSIIHIVDSRRFGTTLVLQDEDGNILHLHFEDAAGGKTGSFHDAAVLEGTLERGELDLPVKLARQAQ